MQWNVCLVAGGEEMIYPSSLCCGGSTGAQARVHAFDGPGGVVVELVVGSFPRIAGPKVEVRLVPDFEVPLRDFVDAVALDEMACEILYELFPFVPVFRRRNILLVPEGMKDAGVGGQLFGHEAELDEGTNVIL